MHVGVRELKTHLSEYVSRAAGGEDIVITDRGRPVVRLVSISGVSEMERGVEEGWIEPARRSALADVPRFRSTRSVSAALDEDRG